MLGNPSNTGMGKKGMSKKLVSMLQDQLEGELQVEEEAPLEDQLERKLEFFYQLQLSICQTIRFYSDNGDMLTAAFITLTFYNFIRFFNPNNQVRNREEFIKQIMVDPAKEKETKGSILADDDENQEPAYPIDKFIDRVLMCFLDHLTRLSMY